MKTIAFALSFTLLALAAAAQNKPDFSGTWIFDKAGSVMGFETLKEMQRGVAVIDHREPLFKFSRAYRFGGQDDEAAFENLTDGTEVEGMDGPDGRWKAFYSMRWDGDALVRTIRLQTPRGEALNTFRFSLLEGGKVLKIEELYKGPLKTLTNLWIFDRKQPEK